jgi:hypothetical protein
MDLREALGDSRTSTVWRSDETGSSVSLRVPEYGYGSELQLDLSGDARSSLLSLRIGNQAGIVEARLLALTGQSRDVAPAYGMSVAATPRYAPNDGGPKRGSSFPPT